MKTRLGITPEIFFVPPVFFGGGKGKGKKGLVPTEEKKVGEGGYRVNKFNYPF